MRIPNVLDGPRGLRARIRRLRGRVRDRTTAVIGAGPAGCAAAHALARAGRQVVLFEAADEVGGRTRTWRDGELRVDSGAGFFTNFYPTLWPLLRALALEDRIQTLSRSNFLVHEGRRAELTLGSVRSFATFPLLSWRAKSRMAAQTALITARYHRLDLSIPETLCALDDESVAQDAVRRLGEELYQIIVRSGIEPFWYFSCEQVSRALALALHARAATARFYTLRDGMDLVCRTLVRDVEVRTGAPVGPIQRDGGRFLLRWPRGEEAFDDLVVATTASVARELTAGLTGDELSPGTRRFLETQTYVPNVHAAFRVRRSDCPPGVSALFPCGPGLRRLAALAFNSHKHQSGSALDGEEIVSVFLSASESQSMLERPTDEVNAHAWALARELCPELPASAVPFRMVTRREAIPVHAVGRYRLAARVHAEQRGPLVFAGDHLATATVDAALRTGFRAARLLVG